MAVQKGRYWVGVLYLENMVESWRDDIGDLLQLPYAYCVHDKDKDEAGDVRKHHVHLILAFSNTTTEKHALNIFSLLSKVGCSCINKCLPVLNIRHMYEYLIHNTDTCRKKGKYLYPVSERILGNNFDIGSYEQLGVAEKNDMCKELCNVIMNKGFTNFGDFYMYVISEFDDTNYFEILKTYSGLFERLTKSNYQKHILANKE